MYRYVQDSTSRCDQLLCRFLSNSLVYRFKSSISDLDKHDDSDDEDDPLNFPDSVSAFICCLICEDNTNISNGLKSFILNGNVSIALVILFVWLVARDIRFIMIDNAKTSLSLSS